MKKILALCAIFSLLAFLAPTVIPGNEAKAQLVTVLKPHAAKDTLTNADTAYIYLSPTSRATGDTVSTSVLDNISRSITLSGKKVSGNTSTSKIYLQATVDGTNYTTLDSLSLANQTENAKTINLRTSDGSLIYKTYRLYCLSAGTCVWVPKGYLLRRSN